MAAFGRGAAAWLGKLAYAAVVLAGCALAGCTTDGAPILAVGGRNTATVAFESIDGPPETVFRRLVLQLNQEAAARQISVVSRDLPAQYRIRAYVAAHSQAKRSTLTWVWDIYNVDRQRMMRLAGEVPAGSDRNAWNTADDQVIGRMARDGMERLVAYLASPNQPGEPAAPPDQVNPNVAFAPADSGAFAFAAPSR